MLEDFKRALARVQSDYGFYIDCQTNPAVALAGYSLSSDERLALSDPVKLAAAFKPGNGLLDLRLRITISGSHDWINRAAAGDATPKDADRDAMVANEVEAIRRASTGPERTGAVARLMELIG